MLKLAQLVCVNSSMVGDGNFLLFLCHWMTELCQWGTNFKDVSPIMCWVGKLYLGWEAQSSASSKLLLAYQFTVMYYSCRPKWSYVIFWWSLVNMASTQWLQPLLTWSTIVNVILSPKNGTYKWPTLCCTLVGTLFSYICTQGTSVSELSLS